MKPHSYRSKQPALRETDAVLGTYNTGTKTHRLNIPQAEISPVKKYFEKIMYMERIFSKETIEAIAGLGSSDGYLNHGYSRPYSGDIDLLVEIKPLDTLLDFYTPSSKNIKDFAKSLKHTIQERTGRNTGYQGLGNIVSTMIPLSRPQKHKERGIQIDLMIIPPQEEGDYLRQYVQEIKFPHHEIYTSIDDDGNYLKAAQANTLFTSQLRQHGITLGETALQKRTFHELDKHDLDAQGTRGKANQIHELMETLTKKIENRKSEKRYKNNDFVQYLIKNPEYLTNASTLNMNGTIGTTAYHDIYDELRDLLTEKHDLPRPYTQVFQEICGINKPTDFISTLDAMQQKHTQGKRNDEEVNDIMTHFSTELVRGNKSKLRFPYIKEQCEQRFAGHIDREAIATKQQVIINNKRTVPEKR